MSKLIWKCRYAWHMHRRTLLSLRFCFEAADIQLHEYPDSIGDDPRWQCDEDLTYWVD